MTKNCKLQDLLKEHETDHPSAHFSQTLRKDCHGISWLGECQGPTYRTLRITALKHPHKLSLPSPSLKEQHKQHWRCALSAQPSFHDIQYSAVSIPSWLPSVLFLLSAFLSSISPLLWRLISLLTLLMKHLAELLFWQHGSSRNRHEQDTIL